MAKVGLIVLFWLSTLVSVLGDDNQNNDFTEYVLSSAGDEAETVKGSMTQLFSQEVDKVTTEFKGAAVDIESSGKDAANVMKEETKSLVNKAFGPAASAPFPSVSIGKTSSWGYWVADKLKNVGLLSSKKPPATAPAPEFGRLLGPAPAPQIVH